jgi:glycosidase
MRLSAALLLGLLAPACAPAARPPEPEIPVTSARVVREPTASPAERTAIYEVFVRDFSPEGTFRGVVEGLDRIVASGANVVWLMPIHPVGVLNRKPPLGSSYSVRDYRALNPDYGTGADFRALVAAVHARGLRLIIDWVPNHTAWDHVWVQQHPEYYTRDAQGGLSVPRDNEGKLTDWTDVADLDYGNQGLRTAMVAAMKYWLDEFGIDGFRVDVAGMVPDDFWREAVPQLRTGRRILLLAEWGEPKLHELGFDLTYGWDSYSRLKAVWQGEPAGQFVDRELEDLRLLPAGGKRLRFTTNHDETAWDRPPVTLFGGPAGARAAFVANALLPGVPLLYNGQEVESPQQLGLFEKLPVDWDRAGADSARGFYRRVLELATSHPAFVAGDLRPLRTDLPQDVIAYARADVLVLVNARPRAASFTVRSFPLEQARDLLTGRSYRGAAVTLPPYGAVVLEPAG